MASPARIHAELIGFLRQHCPVRDHRHLVLLAWMVTGLFLSETVCFDHWKAMRMRSGVEMRRRGTAR